MQEKIDCVGYKFSQYEIFFPSPMIFNQFCVSEDKTELFIISFVRTLLFLLFTKWYYNNCCTKNNDNFVFTILFVLCVMNLIYLLFVMLKTPTDKNIIIK